MKSPRINWRSKTISAIMNIEGMSQSQATSKFNRLYKQALEDVGKHQKGVNVTRELYGSLFYSNVNTFSIGDSGNTIELNKKLKGTKNLSNAIIESRMESFLDKYGDQKFIQEAMNQLKTGQISTKEFNAKIKVFKKWNTKYLKAGS